MEGLFGILSHTPGTFKYQDIIGVCLVLRVITVVVIFLDAADIINPFGY